MKKKSPRARANFRFPAALLAWAKKHAAAKNTSVTQLLVDHLTELKERANGK